MARHRQQRIGDFGRPLVHGMTRYKKYGCRCAVCCADMSAYGKARYIPKPAPKLEPQTHPGPWWASAPQVGMTQLAITDHQARMSAAKITGRVSVPEGWR